jgi:hypothetical protein
MERLEDVLRDIGEAIKIVRLCKCDSAASLLEMAQLELRMKTNNLTEAELSIFCRELERQFQDEGQPTRDESELQGQGAQVIELRSKQPRAAGVKAR